MDDVIKEVLRERYHGELYDGLKLEDINRARFLDISQLSQEIPQEIIAPFVSDPERYVLFVVERHPGANRGMINQIDVFYCWDRQENTISHFYQKRLGWFFSVHEWLLSVLYSSFWDEQVEGMELSVLPDGRFHMKNAYWSGTAETLEELARAFSEHFDFIPDAECVAGNALEAGVKVSEEEIAEEMYAAFTEEVRKLLYEKLHQQLDPPHAQKF